MEPRPRPSNPNDRPHLPTCANSILSLHDFHHLLSCADLAPLPQGLSLAAVFFFRSPGSLPLSPLSLIILLHFLIFINCPNQTQSSPDPTLQVLEMQAQATKPSRSWTFLYNSLKNKVVTVLLFGEWLCRGQVRHHL